MSEKATYEGIYKLLHDYFYGFKETCEGPIDEGIALLHNFFDDGIFTRAYNFPVYQTGDVWFWALCGEHPSHRYDITIDPPHGYVIIDEEKQLCQVQMKEDVYDTELKRNIRAIQNNTTFHVKVKEDGRVVFDKEHITRFPGYFQTDDLIPSPMAGPSWTERDYTDDKNQLAALLAGNDGR